MKLMPLNCSQKINCNRNKMYVGESYIFCSYVALFHEACVIFNIRLLTLRKTLYTSGVKFLTSNSEPITKTLFEFAVSCKMAST
jgi:hypothetical protein